MKNEKSIIISIINQLISKKKLTIEQVSTITKLTQEETVQLIKSSNFECDYEKLFRILSALGQKIDINIQSLCFKFDAPICIKYNTDNTDKNDPIICNHCNLEGESVLNYSESEFDIKYSQEIRRGNIFTTEIEKIEKFHEPYFDILKRPKQREHRRDDNAEKREQTTKINSIVRQLYLKAFICKRCNVVFDNIRSRYYPCSPEGFELLMSYSRYGP